VGISYNTYLRWSIGKIDDQRKGSEKKVPRKLSQEEKDKFYAIANCEEYRDLTPCQIVPILLDKGQYFGSERTLYRLLKEKKALVHRRNSRKPKRNNKPRELIATGPNEVWTWDITWIRTDVKGKFFYAYTVIDIFSRLVVGWCIEDAESPEYAKSLYERIIRDRNVKPKFVHADNGGPMKGVTLTAFLNGMDIGLSYSRPRVSDDNPFIESFFKTLKYNVSYPGHFATLEKARQWFGDFINFYNTKHLHSGIAYVTPYQKHSGLDIAIFEKRQETLNSAARKYPNRFVRGPRKIAPDDRSVILNKAA
jgi:transposase InsO family protein